MSLTQTQMRPGTVRNDSPPQAIHQRQTLKGRGPQESMDEFEAIENEINSQSKYRKTFHPEPERKDTKRKKKLFDDSEDEDDGQETK